jgi:hypothetical protein
MNARTVSLAILTAITSVTALPALADTAQAGGLTRQEVTAEYFRARNAGELDYANEFISQVPQSHKLGRAISAAANAQKIEDLPATAAGKRDDASVAASRASETSE